MSILGETRTQRKNKTLCPSAINDQCKFLSLAYRMFSFIYVYIIIKINLNNLKI